MNFTGTSGWKRSDIELTKTLRDFDYDLGSAEGFLPLALHGKHVQRHVGFPEPLQFRRRDQCLHAAIHGVRRAESRQMTVPDEREDRPIVRNSAEGSIRTGWPARAL
jgi:hypothetical protein